MTFNPEPFQFLPALFVWAFVFAVCLFVGTVATLLVGLLTGGVRGLARNARGLLDGVIDVFRTSPGRVFALATLAFRESVRRRALLVFVIFALLFMFAGWFLSSSDDRPELQVQVHVAFVLTTITYLVLLPMVFLACFGIPEDIRRRSLHTVVTKPVRRGEIVLGRILGTLGIATLVVAVMGVVGYVWIERQVPPEADSALVSREPIYGSLTFRGPDGLPTERGINVGDIWAFRSYVAGASKARGIYTFGGVVPAAMTDVTLRDAATGAETREKFLRLESNFEAFRTYKGDMTRGLYVQYAYADPDAAALARLPAEIAADAARPANNPAEVAAKRAALDYRLQALRDAAANVRRSKWGQAQAAAVAKVADPLAKLDPDAPDLAVAARRSAEATAALDPPRVVDPNVFPIAEFETNLHRVPRKLEVVDERTGKRKTVDLFDDLAPNGRLTVEVGALDGGQYLGMAPPDLFVRTPDEPFVVGYSKAIVGIWLMATLVIVIGTTAGTFVKGPIATVLTLSLLVVGLGFREFMDKLTATFFAQGGQVDGGGPLESIVRIVQHMNPTTPLPTGALTSIIQAIDTGFLYALFGVRYVIPDFGVYNLSEYVANGFDVSWSAGLLPAIGMTLAFVPPCLLLGYLALKSRELESK